MNTWYYSIDMQCGSEFIKQKSYFGVSTNRYIFYRYIFLNFKANVPVLICNVPILQSIDHQIPRWYNYNLNYCIFISMRDKK